jgi:NADPH:quinone reductase-like Zn-dependent oxidoreductase
MCDREGVYPVSGFPFVIGKEASGVVVALPTDESVLNNPDYKKRGYKEGSRVAVVRCAVYTLLAVAHEPTGLSWFTCGIRFCTLEHGICDPGVGVDIDGRLGPRARIDSYFLHGRSIQRTKG